MSDVSNAIDQIKANSTAFRNSSIRGVLGGFVVSGNTQYMDNTTKGIVLTENSEGVATDATKACQMSLNYHTSGNFDGTVAAPATV